MKLTLEPTATLDTVQGVPCRQWKGTTEDGIEVIAWIATVQPQTHDAEKLKAFEQQLKDMPYRRELVSFDVRLAL